MSPDAGDRPARSSTVIKDMALTEAEFFRVLQRAFAPCDALPDAIGLVMLKDGRRRLEIHFRPLPPRRLGALSLPRAKAVLHFVAFEAEAEAAAVAAFDRAFQRGGG